MKSDKRCKHTEFYVLEMKINEPMKFFFRLNSVESFWIKFEKKNPRVRLSLPHFFYPNTINKFSWSEESFRDEALAIEK